MAASSDGTTAYRRTRGPTDPARRDRIAQAACAVVAAHGVEGVTHRAVAAEANVPVGSTTYHFKTLDDLLSVALEAAATTNIRNLRAWEASLPPDADLADALTELVIRYTSEERHQTIVEYELYVAALHRSRLRDVATAWDAALVEVFTARTDVVTGRLIAAAVSGLLIQTLLKEPALSTRELRQLFERALLAGAQADS